MAWCRMLCAAICFSTSARLGPYGSAFSCFCGSQHYRAASFSSGLDVCYLEISVEALAHLFFIQQRPPVDPRLQLQIWHQVIELPEGAAVLGPAIVQIFHAWKAGDAKVCYSGESRQVWSGEGECGSGTLDGM